MSMRRRKHRLLIWERHGQRINAVNPPTLQQMPNRYWEALFGVHTERIRRDLPSSLLDLDWVNDEQDGWNWQRTADGGWYSGHPLDAGSQPSRK
jgi:hypothetical protein